MIKDKTESLMYMTGEKVLQFGKYEGEQIKNVPESYAIFVAENHKPNKLNEDLKYYGFQLINNRKKVKKVL